MDSKEFIKACIDGGYVVRSKIKKLEEWVERNPKVCYTECNFIEAYRYCESFRHGEDIPWGRWKYMHGGVKTTKHYNQDNSFNR